MEVYKIVSIITTPIFVYSIYILFNTFFNEKVLNKSLEICSYVLYCLILILFIFIHNTRLFKLIFTLFSFFLITLNYNSSIQKKIIFISLTYSILLIIEFSTAAIFCIFNNSFYYNGQFSSAVGIASMYTLDLTIAYLIKKHKKFSKKDYPISKIYCITSMVILFGTLFLFISSLERPDIKFYNVIIDSIILITVNITMLRMDEKIYNLIIVTNEKSVLQQQNIAYENQMKIVEETVATINTIKHDMKNHLLMIKELYKNNKENEIYDYVKDITERIDGDTFSKSNNFIIDSIINWKLRQIKDSDIKISLNINVPQKINVLPYDLTIILGNLLDNAITAVSKSDEKKLEINLSYNKGNLFIFIYNSYDGIIIEEENKLQTTKLNKKEHGIGIKSIEKTLEIYGGEMTITHNECIFSVSIILPCDIQKP